MKRAFAVAAAATVSAMLACGSSNDSTSPGSGDRSTLAARPPSLIKVSLTAAGKNPEGGIAVNTVTHKAYVISEHDIEGDDQYAVFVIDNSSFRTKAPSKKLTLKLPSTASAYAAKAIPIPYENEYITVDSARNLIYVPTRFHIQQNEPPDSDTGGDDEAPGGADAPVLEAVTALEPVTIVLGSLTVIDGNTDQVIASWYFDLGVEPEGVAVDPATGIVYVGTKAPEGEAAEDDTCASGTPIPDIGEPADVECWTAGSVHAFFADRNGDGTGTITWLKTIPAGDDPESVVFENGMVYAANEDDGTVTVATAVALDGSGGILLTDFPTPPFVFDPVSQVWNFQPYSLVAFTEPNPQACLENQFEADKMASGGGSVFLTDDRSRVAKIGGTDVVATAFIPGATDCEYVPNTDGGGLNSANNIAYMRNDGGDLLYVVSEQNTIAIYDPLTLTPSIDPRTKAARVITVPTAVHLDGIAIDADATRVWLTDEDLHAVFVLQGACALGTATCSL